MPNITIPNIRLTKTVFIGNLYNNSKNKIKF